MTALMRLKGVEKRHTIRPYIFIKKITSKKIFFYIILTNIFLLGPHYAVFEKHF